VLIGVHRWLIPLLKTTIRGFPGLQRMCATPNPSKTKPVKQLCSGIYLQLKQLNAGTAVVLPSYHQPASTTKVRTLNCQESKPDHYFLLTLKHLDRGLQLSDGVAVGNLQ